MKEIVFIVNQAKQARCIRRIQDFIDRGYKVHVYAFDREEDTRVLPNFPITILGVINNGRGFFKRIMFLRQTIKNNIVDKFRNKDVIYYYFFIDIAMVAFSVNKGKYIYEISDLPELRFKGLLRSLMILVNKILIKKSIETIFTSDGFKEFYCKNYSKNNITVLPNKLNKKCLELGVPTGRNIDMNKLCITFTGVIRFESIYLFTKVIAEKFPHIILSLWGIYSTEKERKRYDEIISKYSNIKYLGPFNNYCDFYKIHKDTDLILSFYDNNLDFKYLEPNKLYESIFYEKPIIVYENCFLGKRTKELNIGFTINTISEDAIKSFIEGLTIDDIKQKTIACNNIPKVNAIDSPESLFKKLDNKL